MDSAVALRVPDVEALVAPWRARGQGVLDVPSHVLLLHPFLPAELVDVGVEEELAWFFAGVDGFALEFAALEARPDGLWLLPEPAAEVTALVEALARRWPEAPAPTPTTPRLAVTSGDPEVVGAARADLEPRLPLRTVVAEAALWRQDRDGTWGPVRDLPLAPVEA